MLHNNDGESQLISAPGEPDFGGVARFATVVANEKAAAESCNAGGNKKCGLVLVSSGDNFLAGPEFNASLNNGVWYDAMALDMLGYDAISLGNHDFDFGPNTLAASISEGFSDPGTPPYLAANLDFSAEPALQAGPRRFRGHRQPHCGAGGQGDLRHHRRHHAGAAVHLQPRRHCHRP